MLKEVKHRHSRRALMVAAAIVGEVTDGIYENIFYANFDELEESGIDGHAGDASE